MTEKEYFNYLIDLAHLDGIDSGNRDYSDQLFGLFQCFMPSGEAIDKVFEPIPNGELYADRIRPIYALTESSVTAQLKEGFAPAYFVPPGTDCTETELMRIGNELIEKFRLFAAHIENPELLDALDAIEKVEIVESDVRQLESDTHELLDDAISDWTYDNKEDEELLEILSEAYYSIACDYWLSYYFQFPRYTNKPAVDFLAPYFDLWKKGYTCSFGTDGLLIGKL